ncbi:MAG: pyruvate formate lyase family protein, partial [Chloroflexota bacterium]
MSVTERVARLRRRSLEAQPTLSTERAELMTEFYQSQAERSRGLGAVSIPLQRAQSFAYLMEHKTIYIGEDELIVGEKGPAPKATPTYPELCCHSLQDLEILDARPKIPFAVSPAGRQAYAERVIPFWQGASMRDLLFSSMSPEWLAAYEAGIFTEFMEQRAPGHTVLDDKIYTRGMLDFQQQIRSRIERLDYLHDPQAYARREELQAMDVAAGALIRFGERHAELALRMAETETSPARRAELQRIAEVCRRVPAHVPRSFWEALQYYWFVHLGVTTELNTWDAFCPGHLDHHLAPFYTRGLAEGRLLRSQAEELLQCFWIKFNNQPAPPKVGVTAAESGTYTDFANINLAGVDRDGHDASNEVSFLLLEVIDEMHILQPSNNIQISRQTPDAFLKAACR